MMGSQNYTYNVTHSALYIKMLPFKITTTVTTLHFIRPTYLSIQLNSFSVDK